MNKKILKAIIGICFALMFMLYIGAQENFNYSEEPNVVYENLDYLLENNISAEEENLTKEDINLNFEENFTKEENLTKNESHIQESNSSSGKEDSSEESLTNSEESSSSKTHEEYEENSFEYLELENITENESHIQENSEKEKTNYVYYVNGKKEIEMQAYERIDITKEEVEKNEFEKEITISSKEHVDEPLRVYTDLTTEAKKEEIKIYWKNEGDWDITNENEFEVEYYDENDNGLIDRISWMVPHLSEQIFEVVIKTNFIDNGSSDLILDVEVDAHENPIKFYINVSYDYPENVNCSLNISKNSVMEFFEYFVEENKTLGISNLENGEHNWTVICFDLIHPEADAKFGSFEITEEFSVFLNGGDLNSKLYLLDLVKNDLKTNGTVEIASENPSKIRIELRRDGLIHYTKNISEEIIEYSLPLNKTILNQSGNYNLTVHFDKPSARNSTSVLFSVASANIIFNKTSPINEGESIKVTAIINSPSEIISYVIFDYGNGTIYNTEIEPNPFIKDFIAKYSDGTFNIKLNSFAGIGFNIQKTLTVTDDGTDTQDPDITLLSPKDEEIIYGDVVNFSYKASDNVKLKNCTFKLYDDCASLSLCAKNSSNLVYTETKTNPENNVKIEIALKDFDEKNYMWLVECFDNSSNYGEEYWFLRVNLNGTTLSSSKTNYTQKAEIEELMNIADNFLNGEYSLEELEILEDLNLLNDTKYYKKRLTDIDQSLASGFRTYSEEQRKKKTAEYLAELEEIKTKLPKSIFIGDSYEFIKNSVGIDFAEVVEDYFASTNTHIGRATIQKLARLNKEIQNEITVSSKIKNVQIEYLEETKRITLVKKVIKLNDDSYNQIIEIIPKEIAKDYKEVFFLVDHEVIKEDPVFEIDYEDLKNNAIIYYIEGFSKLEDFEKTETLLFEDDLGKGRAGVTGFFVISLGSADSVFYVIIAFILLIVLSFVIIFVIEKFRMLSWKKEPNVVRVANLISDIKKRLAEKEIEEAREKYNKIKEIYPLLPNKTKPYFYGKIKEILVRIDKKDIFGLVREYQEAKRNWNKDNYMRLYQDIRKIYERLPEKDRKRVYDIINGY